MEMVPWMATEEESRKRAKKKISDGRNVRFNSVCRRPATKFHNFTSIELSRFPTSDPVWPDDRGLVSSAPPSSFDATRRPALASVAAANAAGTASLISGSCWELTSTAKSGIIADSLSTFSGVE